MTRGETIPLADIASIQIYHKRKVRERDMMQILEETGGDLVLNGTIFSWTTGKPLCYCKADGEYLCKPDYSVVGVGWDAPGDFRQLRLPNLVANAITCVPLIVSGQPVDKPNYQQDMGGARSRTAIGLKEGRLAYYVTSDSCTPEALRDLLYRSGWDTAIMLDGGGSSCIRDKSGEGFCCAPDRKIPHYIVITLRDKEPEEDKPMVEINAYSKAKDGGKALSDNFAVREFACKDGSDPVLVAPRLVMLLQSIRSHFGKAVTINSGYRTPQHNAKEGGAATSQHCYGTAADIAVAGVTPAKVAAYARSLMPNWGGVGIYKTYAHVDVRDTRADWEG